MKTVKNRHSLSLAVFGSQLYGSRGEVVSPLYPQRYMGYQDVSWTITVPWGKYISITFLELDVEGDPVEDECYASLVVSDTLKECLPVRLSIDLSVCLFVHLSICLYIF